MGKIYIGDSIQRGYTSPQVLEKLTIKTMSAFRTNCRINCLLQPAGEQARMPNDRYDRDIYIFLPTSENSHNWLNIKMAQYEISSFIDQLKDRFYCNIQLSIFSISSSSSPAVSATQLSQFYLELSH